VNVVRNSTCTHTNILGPIQQRSQICMHLAANAIPQKRLASLRTENQMHQYIRDRLRHGSEYSAGLQPAVSPHTMTWGVAPGYRSTALQAAPSLLAATLA
jgi:hypothetical protein